MNLLKNRAINTTANKSKSMSFFDHISELRKRIFICFIAIAIGACVTYIYAPNIIKWIAQFYVEASKQDNAQLSQTSVLDGFVLRIKVATYGGVIFSSPIWLFQLWRFITPGLNPKEKRYAIPFIFSSELSSDKN